jgi:hypothetical protein
MRKVRVFTRLGKMTATSGVMDLIKKSREYDTWVRKCLTRYSCCDWGSIGEEDKAKNDEAVKGTEDCRVIARYDNPEGDILIITERFKTHILLAGEK